jgi:5'-methylthioadenosine phosphorylase
MHSEPVGVVGGSGFYRLLEQAGSRAVETPYGVPSGELTTGTLAGRDVVFLPRHGADHRYAPHVVPYRANLWALRSLGVRQVVSLSAVGSLTPRLPTGSLVVPDQLIDRTSGRAHTFWDAGTGVGHATFADPYCPRGLAAAAGSAEVSLGGVLVVVNGPRFSTRAESQQLQRAGCSIIGMTAMPEASLARELGLCYTTLALVTDLDAGVEQGEGVSHEQVLAAFAANLPRLRELLVGTLGRLPGAQGDCPCATVAQPVP